MFNIIIKTTGPDFGRGVLAFQGAHNKDWMRQDMAHALALVFGETAVEEEAGSPAQAGVLRVWAGTVSPVWCEVLGVALERANWDYRTRKGYGNFVELLLALKADVELATMR